jgi:hypothetical protein
VSAPQPADKGLLQYEVALLQRDYLELLHTDPAFSARAKAIGRFLDQLDSIHQIGDHESAGFLVAALLEKLAPDLGLMSSKDASELRYLRGERKSLLGHVESWIKQGHTTVGLDFLRRNLMKEQRS